MDNWAVATSSSSVDVFRVSAAGVLRTAHFVDKVGWSAWSVLSGAILPANQHVCAVASGTDDVHAFVVDKNGTIQHVARLSTATQWQGPFTVPSSKVNGASLAAAFPAGGSLILFSRTGAGASAGAIMRSDLDGLTNWSGWASVGDPIITAAFDDKSLSAVTQTDGKVHLLANSDAGPQHTVLSGGSSSGATWTTVVGTVQGRPSGVSRSTTTFDVVTIDPFMISTSDTAIADGSWHGWQYSDQDADSQPAKGVALDGSTVAVIGYGEVAAGSGVIVSRVSIDDSGKAKWGAWQLVPGSLDWDGTELCALLRSERYLHIFVNHGDGMVATMCDTALANWSWSAWQEIQGPAGPHWQLANKLPQLTRMPSMLQRLPSWISIILGRKS